MTLVSLIVTGLVARSVWFVTCGILWFVPHLPDSCRACSPPGDFLRVRRTASVHAADSRCSSSVCSSYSALFPTSILISFNVRCRDANYAAHHIFNTLARFTGRAVCMLERTRHTGTFCSDRRFTAVLRLTLACISEQPIGKTITALGLPGDENRKTCQK